MRYRATLTVEYEFIAGSAGDAYDFGIVAARAALDGPLDGDTFAVEAIGERNLSPTDVQRIRREIDTPEFRARFEAARQEAAVALNPILREIDECTQLSAADYATTINVRD